VGGWVGGCVSSAGDTVDFVAASAPIPLPNYTHDARPTRRREAAGAPKAAANASYLQQKLRYDGDRLVDEDGEAVMMGWELPLMVEHAKEVRCAALAAASAPCGFIKSECGGEAAWARAGARGACASCDRAPHTASTTPNQNATDLHQGG